MIERILQKLKCYYYKKQLEHRVGRKLPSVVVRGKLSFENGSINVGENVILYPNVTFAGNGTVTIGSGCKIGQDTIIYANKNGGVEIGDNTIIAAQGYIVDSNHGFQKKELISKQPLVSFKIMIGNDVWIGANATILSGVRVANGAVIGAKSLVNKDVPQYAIAVGVPAEIKGYRKDS